MNKVLVLLLFSISTKPADPYVVQVAGKECVQKLYKQPAGGPFSVFVFCDDALGVNIGVINTAGGAGPGAIQLSPQREWSKWDVNDRFWQKSEWATDVTSFAWSLDLKFLYVATSEVYGTGATYRLNLVDRTSTKVAPKSNVRIVPGQGYSTKILGIDRKTGSVSVALETFNEISNKTEVTKLTVK